MDSVAMRYEDKQFDVRYDPAKYAPKDFLDKIAESKRFTPSVAGAIRAQIEGSILSISAACDTGAIAQGKGGRVQVTLSPGDEATVGGEKRPTKVAADATSGVEITGAAVEIEDAIEDDREVDLTYEVGKDTAAGWRNIEVTVSFHTGNEDAPTETLALTVPVHVKAAPAK